MKTRRLVSLISLLAALMAASVSATAEEKGGAVSSPLSSTTISGYVDTAVNWQLQPTPDTTQHEHRGWWQRLLHRFGLHRHG